MHLHIQRSYTLNASRERLWRVLAEEFASVAEWADGVAASRPDPDAPPFGDSPVGGRVCTVDGFGTVTERLTHFDPEGGSFAYDAWTEGLPRFVSGLSSRYALRALGPERSEVRVTVAADLHGLAGLLARPWVRRRFVRVADRAIADLARHIAGDGGVAVGGADAPPITRVPATGPTSGT